MIRQCSDTDIPSILAIINEAARVYQGVIPVDCWHDPYMPESELLGEIGAGVQFWGWEDSSTLVGVMGIQKVRDATLIRHAYVLPSRQGCGIGSALLATLISQANGQVLVGTWAAAKWAIRFYGGHGFVLVEAEEKDQLAEAYWKISGRQWETSVVLRYVQRPRRENRPVAGE